jgi:HlyD family secretion protein
MFVSRLAFLFLIALAACNIPDSTNQYVIQKGDFQSVLTETGELQALNARVVTMPYIGWRYGWNFKVTGLVDHGALVEKGDSIAQFDGSTVQTRLLERQNKLEVEKVALNKLLVEQQIKLQNLKSRIAISEAAYHQKKLQVEKFKFESERSKIIKQKELEKAEIELRKSLDNYQRTISTNDNELKIQKIKIRQIEYDIVDAEAALSQLTVKSPINGMIQVLENRRSRNIFQLGDDISQGQPFISVPDMSKMKVKSVINENDYFKAFIGQKVVVRLDAFPLKQFHGEISDIGKLSRKKDEKSTVKVFDIVVLLDDSDPILKPGMTVSCDIYTSQLEDVYYVENECIFQDGVNNYILLDNGAGKDTCIVVMGPGNSKHTVISGDLEAGWKVVPRNNLSKAKI